MSDPMVTLGDLNLFGDDEFGVSWFVPRGGLDWSGAPATTLELMQRPRGHGAWSGASYRQARSYSLTAVLQAPNRALAEAAVDRALGAAPLDGALLTVAESSVTRSTMVRRDDEILVTWLNDTSAQISLGLVAADPRKFGATLTGSTGLPSSTGGLTFPHTFPHTFDAVTVTGQVSLFNPGNVAGPVRLRIDGPVTAPVVTHVSSGRSLVFSSSLVLGAGQWVDVDMDRREVLENGQSSRNGWVTGRGWSAFEPGDNTWAFTAGTYDAGSLLTVYATPAWE